MLIDHKGENMFNATANINPETCVSFGYVAANDLDQDLVDRLIYGGVNESQLECEQESYIHGEYEGVKYATSWLGGALNFFILESPVITTKACRASPCVPNAGILKHPEDPEGGSVESYGIPEDWWAECW